MRRRSVFVCFAAVLSLSLMAVPAAASLRPGTLFLDAVSDDLTALRTESEECALCHIEDSLGRATLYGGDVASYENASDHAHSAPMTPCPSCHVRHGEHGMGGALADKLLRVGTYQAEVVRELAGGDADAITDGAARADGWDPREIQLTAFCTTCHPAYSSRPDQEIAVPEQAEDGSIVVRYRRHHPLRALDGALHYRTTRYGSVQIAARATVGCTSCHGAGTGTSAFPHSTPGSVHFLLSAPDADTTAGPAPSSRSDGICLRCHAWKTGAGETRGVGVDW